MVPGPIGEFSDLTAVHGCYVQVLQQSLGHPLPVPAGLSGGAGSPDRLAVQINILRRWLNLLDLAVSPALLRSSLVVSKTSLCEALLRYFVQKPNRNPADRDKADFVATSLYRQKHGLSRGTGPGGPTIFEQELHVILGCGEDVPLSPEHSRLAREFDFIREEVTEFSDFDGLMDSGIIDRVREVKRSFGESFYHPHVLAITAEYNVFVGERFGQLFREAARHIKSYAEKVQQEGGSILSRVDDDVTVKHLVELEEAVILQQEYTHGREHLHKVSRYKKAVDKRHRRPATAVARATVLPPGAPPLPMGITLPSAAPRTISPEANARLVSNPVEEGKLSIVEHSICQHVRSREPIKSSMVIALSDGNASVAPAEAEAFRADFGAEKSFRADYAVAHRKMVAIQARIALELDNYGAKQDSAHLWKPHAQSLAYLRNCAERMIEEATAVVATAQQRGLLEKVAAMNATLQRLRWDMQRVCQTLETVPGEF